MTTATLITGSLLFVLGVGAYVLTGMDSPTALIPALFGAVLETLGLLGQSRPQKRALYMHVAAIVAAIGFAGALPGLMKLSRALEGDPTVRANAVYAQAAMAVITLVYLLLAFRSFAAARRRRTT